MHAQNMVQKVCPFLETLPGLEVVTIQSPQQTNGVDCGIYTKLMADAITKKHIEGRLHQP